MLKGRFNFCYIFILVYMCLCENLEQKEMIKKKNLPLGNNQAMLHAEVRVGELSPGSELQGPD